MEPRDVLDDIERGDLAFLRLKLHPDLHWETPDGRTLRGRRHVLAELEGGAAATEPREVELRDGQIYRWLVPASSRMPDRVPPDVLRRRRVVAALAFVAFVAALAAVGVIKWLVLAFVMLANAFIFALTVLGHAARIRERRAARKRPPRRRARPTDTKP